MTLLTSQALVWSPESRRVKPEHCGRQPQCLERLAKHHFSMKSNGGQQSSMHAFQGREMIKQADVKVSKSLLFKPKMHYPLHHTSVYSMGTKPFSTFPSKKNNVRRKSPRKLILIKYIIITVFTCRHWNGLEITNMEVTAHNCGSLWPPQRKMRAVLFQAPRVPSLHASKPVQHTPRYPASPRHTRAFQLHSATLLT